MSNPNPAVKFPKGVSGNPKGRPKREWTMTGLIEQALEQEKETGVFYKAIVAKKLVDLASAGDLGAIKEINNRIDGMSQQNMDIKSDGEKIQAMVVIDTKPE